MRDDDDDGDDGTLIITELPIRFTEEITNIKIKKKKSNRIEFFRFRDEFLDRLYCHLDWKENQKKKALINEAKGSFDATEWFMFAKKGRDFRCW